jgi:hypothetical protein
MFSFSTEIGWATIWANFSKTLLVRHPAHHLGRFQLEFLLQFGRLQQVLRLQVGFQLGNLLRRILLLLLVALARQLLQSLNLGLESMLSIFKIVSPKIWEQSCVTVT